VVVTTILTGMLLVPDLKFTQAMLIVLIGSAIGILPLVLVGLIFLVRALVRPPLGAAKA
jgi:purine-cytosine permease-like protein